MTAKSADTRYSLARKNDLRWGLNYGLAMAMIYSVLGIAILQSADVRSSELLWLVLMYFAAGVSSGLLLGVFRRTLTTRKRSVTLGIIIAYPAAFVISFASVEQPLPITYEHWLVATFLAVVFGAWAGWFFGPGGWGSSGSG